MSRSLILAIDGGATHTVSLLADEQGVILGRGSGGAANHLLESMTRVRDSLEAACSQALEKRANGEVGIVCAGTAGIEYDGQGRREIVAILHNIFPRAEIMATADAVIALEGALARDEGIVMISGTGSIILGRDSQGRLVKVGGWGPFYGNEGSGEFVIREALRAAARECDGRGPSTRLSEAICRSLQLKNFSESIAEIYREGMQWQKVAPLGAVVASVALEGDEVAREIFKRAALDLAVALQAAASRLSLKPPVAISYQGSLFKAGQVLLNPLRKQLRQLIPEAQLNAPIMSPLGGAYRLARKRLGKAMTAGECRDFGRRLESSGTISPPSGEKKVRRRRESMKKLQRRPLAGIRLFFRDTPSSAVLEHCRPEAGATISRQRNFFQILKLELALFRLGWGSMKR